MQFLLDVFQVLKVYLNFLPVYKKQLLSIVCGRIKMHLLLNEFQFEAVQLMIELQAYQVQYNLQQDSFKQKTEK